MKHYQSKAELATAIQTALDKYLAEFADIPEAARHTRATDSGKTPSEHLSYQLGWVTALLAWEKREQAGEAVQTPAPGYKWNALGDLNQHYYHTTAHSRWPGSRRCCGKKLPPCAHGLTA